MWRAALLRLGFGALAFAIAGIASAADTVPLRVVYPRSESTNDARGEYPLAVLRLALDKSGRAFRLQASRATMQQARSLRLLEQGRAVDVVWSQTSRERETRLRAIRFPIDRGLLGWRVLLIRKGDAARFREVTTVAALSRWRAGQGHDWPDLGILRANGLKVEASPTYEGLFAMLAKGHIDYFPRAFSEVHDELDAHRGAPFELEPGLVLHYPTALYFFVAPDNAALAEALETGLERSQRDGSLQALFDRHYGPAIARTALAQRRILRMDNPLLPPQTPLQRRALWFRPEDRRETTR